MPRINLKLASDLDALYAELPKIECQQKCQRFCTYIEMAKLERDRVIDAMGEGQSQKYHECPILDRKTGDCRAYEVRPLICRLFGITEGMPCPHGCKVERVLTDEEAREFIVRVHNIGGAPAMFAGATRMKKELTRISRALDRSGRSVGDARRGLPRASGPGARGFR